MACLGVSDLVPPSAQGRTVFHILRGSVLRGLKDRAVLDMT